MEFYRGKASRKWEFVRGNMLLEAEKGMATCTCAHKHESWWVIPRGRWERFYTEVIQLWHQGFALCAIRFTIMSDTQEVTQLRNYTALWNASVMWDKQKRWRFCCKQFAIEDWTQGPSNHFISLHICCKLQTLWGNSLNLGEMWDCCNTAVIVNCFKSVKPK